MHYRQNNGPIVPLGLSGRVSWNSPPPGAGELAMEVDLQGRLNDLRATLSRKEQTRSDDVEDGEEKATDVDWPLVFELAGLDITKFEPATPTVRPEGFADARLAWTGTIPDYNDRAVRVEAASLEGKPVFFSKIISSDSLWTTEGEPAQQQSGTGFLIAAVVMLVIIGLLVIGGALFLAVRNLKLGRGDRKGAFRIAAFVFSMRSLHWALAGDHVGHPAEIVPLVVAICGATTLALLAWIVYVACEPYVRRLWPEAMVSWTRVLSARFRDPLVGRDVLIGCTFATAISLISVTILWVATKIGLIGVVPMQQHVILLRGGRYAVGELFSVCLTSTAAALVIMMLFLLLRMICRKTLIAGVMFCLLWGIIGGLNFIGVFGAGTGVLGVALQISTVSLLVVVLVRFGLLALVACMIFAGLSNISLLTFNASAPFFGLGLFITAVAFTLAAYGWHTSLAGRSLMQDTLLEP
jgi:hypothetical protein